MNNNQQIAVFAGGCFWCTEAIFKSLNGVISVMSGYTGGTVKNPDYMSVINGKTGHVEAVKIVFDPVVISYDDLLTVFFNTHDPTTINQQGNDVGEQYRSVIFYSSPEQKESAEKFITELNNAHAYEKSVVTEVKPLGEFYDAEEYHRDYYEKNKDAPYCEIVIAPKLEKLQKRFAELVNHI